MNSRNDGTQNGAVRGASWLPGLREIFGRAHRNANPDMASTGKAYTSIACGIMLKSLRIKFRMG